MLSGQMIYTACGKDKSGAFSVWSKSEIITKEECNEIIKLMTYNRPRNAPYDPSPEEIVKCFPAKYGYFALSTGKLCVAKSSYIGDVYSELDSRSGNFLIHAYVFDKLDKVSNPFFLANVDFKTKLEYSEWHDNPAPETLHEVELCINQAVSEGDIKQIISTDRELFVSLAQALLNCCKDDKVVIFSDNDDTVRSYCRAISLLLPHCLYKKLTYANQYYPQSEYTLLGLGMPPIKIRNISDDFLLTAFNYQQALNEGKYVFNRGKGICSTLSPERYLEDIILTVEQKGLYAATKKVESVNKIMEDLNCDENVAIKVFHLKEADIDWFKFVDEFMESFDLVCAQNYIDHKWLASVIDEKIIIPKKIHDEHYLILSEYVYRHSDFDVKNRIFFQYMGSMCWSGKCESWDENTIIKYMKAVPAYWNDRSNYLCSADHWEEDAKLFQSYFPFSYLWFTIAMSSFSSHPEEAEKTVVRLLDKSLSNHNLSELEKYLELINTNGQDFRNKLWDVVVLPMSKQSLQNEESIEFLFALMRLTNDIDQRNTMFENMIATNGGSQNFMPTYVKCFEANKSMLASIERELREKGTYEAFFMLKEAYGFKVAPQVNARMLLDYFEKFYKPGYDQGAYLAKIKLYLSSQPPKMKVYEALKQYGALKELQDGFKDLLQIVQVIEKEIYSVNIPDLLSVNKEQLALLDEIDCRLRKNACKTSGSYEILLVALTLTGKNGRDKRFEAVTNKTVYANMSNAQLSYISEYFMEHLLNLYLDAKKQLKLDYKQLIATIIVPIINIKDFERDFIGVISSSGDFIEIVADVIAYAHNNQTNAAVSLKKIMERYVDSMQRSEYKSLFKKLSGYISSDDMIEVQKYIDEFMEAHKGFLESLFAKKKTR